MLRPTGRTLRAGRIPFPHSDHRHEPSIPDPSHRRRLSPRILRRRGSFSGRAPVAAAPDDEKAIRAVLDAQVAAWNKGDLDGFMAGYWNDDKLFYISGGEGIRAGRRQRSGIRRRTRARARRWAS